MNQFLLFIFIIFASPVMAGPLTAPSAPTDPGSALYTLEDIYQRLNTGAPGAKRTAVLTEPTAAPATTGHSLDDIMSKAPLPDNTYGATTADVTCGMIFWGVRTDGTWGQQTGTAPPCPP